jgi:HlyD family secretion protein
MHARVALASGNARLCIESGRRAWQAADVRRKLTLALTLLPWLWLAASCRPPGQTHCVSGTIETDEVRVASRYGGRVVQTPVSEGDGLKPGQVIVVLEAPELQARRAQTAALLAEQVAGPRPQEIAAAKHDWEAAQAELDFARADARRAEQLFAQKMAPESDRDRAVTRAQAQENVVAAARSRYDLLLAGTRPEEIARTQAQLAELATQVRELQVVAPTNCVLEVLSVKVGDVLPANREVATLLLAQHLWVRVFVPEPWLGHIQLGEPVKVRVDSFPGRDLAGTVEQIARAAEFTPRNVQTVGERVKQVFGIRVRLDGASGELRAGMAADVCFPRTAAGRN